MTRWIAPTALGALILFLNTAGAAPLPSILVSAAGIHEGESLHLTIGLDPVDQGGTPSDWWIVSYGPSGWQSFGFGPTGFGWEGGLVPILQVPLVPFSNLALPPVQNLTPGAYVFVFAVDTVMNGALDMGQLSLAYVLVDVAAGAPDARLETGDFQYRGAFRLPGGDDPPLTFAYGGNAMTFNPDGNPGGGTGFPGSLFVMGHDRIAYGGVPDGNQIAEISIPVPVDSRNVEDLPVATFIQDFHKALAGRFTAMEEIPKVGMAYLNHPLTGPKLHVVWGQHLQPDNAASHAWISADLADPDFRGSWFLGSENLYSVNGYALTIPQAWADTHLGGKYLASGRMRDGGQGGMGPALFAYRPWQDDGSAPPDGARLTDIPLLLYADVTQTDSIERALTGYQHPDEWEGAEWITSPSGKTALLFAGTKATGSKYWYGYRHPNGPDTPCVDTHFTDFLTCRTAAGDACPAGDFGGCCDPDQGTCISYRGWWSTRFDAQFILYDPADLAAVAARSMEPWQPQPYATLDIDDHLYLNPPEWDVVLTGSGDQRRYRISDAAYDPGHGYLYVLEQLADGGKPVVHVWQLR